jgi:hypothetical protein
MISAICAICERVRVIFAICESLCVICAICVICERFCVICTRLRVICERFTLLISYLDRRFYYSRIEQVIYNIMCDVGT